MKVTFGFSTWTLEGGALEGGALVGGSFSSTRNNIGVSSATLKEANLKKRHFSETFFSYYSAFTKGREMAMSMMSSGASLSNIFLYSFFNLRPQTPLVLAFKSL